MDMGGGRDGVEVARLRAILGEIVERDGPGQTRASLGHRTHDAGFAAGVRAMADIARRGLLDPPHLAAAKIARQPRASDWPHAMREACDRMETAADLMLNADPAENMEAARGLYGDLRLDFARHAQALAETRRAWSTAPTIEREARGD